MRCRLKQSWGFRLTALAIALSIIIQSFLGVIQPVLASFHTYSKTIASANKLRCTNSGHSFFFHLATRYYNTDNRIEREEYAPLADGTISAQQYTYTLVNPSDRNSPVTQFLITDPENRVTKYVMDPTSLYVQVVKDGYDKSTTTLRDSVNNRVLSITDRLGRTTTPSYDDQENLTQVQTPDLNSTHYSYDNRFNLVNSVTEAVGKTISRSSTLEYDSYGNPKIIKDPLLHQTTLNYDPNVPGKLNSIINSKQQLTTFSYYDANGLVGQGNLKTVTDPLGHTSTFVYDNLNRLIQVTNHLQQTVKYEYDNLNRRTKVTSAENRVVLLTYDENSNVKQVTDPKGNITSYTYDNGNRLITRTDASGKIESYQYDRNGNVKSMTNRRGQITQYVYDLNNRLQTITYADGSVVTSSYDDGDRAIRVTDTADNTSTSCGLGCHSYQYDVMDNLKQEATPRGTVTYRYDELNRRVELKVNGTRTLSYSWDSNDNLQTINEAGKIFDYDYDELDRRVALTMPNGVKASYGYDLAGRLGNIEYKKDTVSLTNLTYGYNELNQRTSLSGSLITPPKDSPITSTVTNNLNQYTSFNGQAQSYDNNGNQLSGGFTATWDARDRLVSLTGTNITASFKYDVSGRRVSKTINGKTQNYLYDGADIIQESGNKSASYTYGVGVDEPLLRKTSTQREYYLADALGSIIGLTDDTATIKTAYSYSPYGKKTTTGFASDNPYGFTGREDDGTGLYFYRARYYSPDQKRFIAEDPLEFGGGDTNFYAYVGNDPINWKDPSGELPGDFLNLDIADTILWSTLIEMKTRSIRGGADQYFHCMAACDATKATGDPNLVRKRLEYKENFDYLLNKFGLYKKGGKMSEDEMLKDMAADLTINDYGIACPNDTTCKKRCSPIIDSLSARSRKLMKDYGYYEK